MLASTTALCSDFYVNQKLGLKMDLPTARESVLHMFDRVRKELPDMDRFRRYDGELALESPDLDARYAWLALNQTSIRTGAVNPESLEHAYRLHRLILDISPYFLSISPLDMEFVELVFGFDLEAETNRNEVVFEALIADSPLAPLVDLQREHVLDAQPFLGLALNERCDLQAFVEVKTHARTREIATRRFDADPISVYLTVRKYGPFQAIDDFTQCFGTLAGHGERLAEERVIPHVVVPIRERLMGKV